MRIVLDTNILVRANISARGPARELLTRIIASFEHRLLISPFLLNELERVFSYGRIRALSRLSNEEVDEYLSYLRAENVTELIFPGPAPRVVPSDPADDPIVHTAVVGQADFLCTLNRHFYDASVVEYCQNRGIVITGDVSLIALLRAKP